MALLLSLSIMPTQGKAAVVNTADTTSMPAAVPPVTPEAQLLLDRLNEIKEMDKSNLTPAEKKELRKELRETKKELRQVSDGVYISAGALIVILLLLIILL